MDSLTLIQARVLEAIRSRVERGESVPTYRDLCAEFGWSSTGTVRDHLRALARKGFIELAGRRARKILLRRDCPRPGQVPIIGWVAAGLPIPAEEVGEGLLRIPPEWRTGGRLFALRVCGESMRDAGILNGDIVVASSQQHAHDGDIVVATLHGETTLKRLRSFGDNASLTSENIDFESIPIGPDGIMVQGVIVGLVRSYSGTGRLPTIGPCGTKSIRQKLNRGQVPDLRKRAGKDKLAGSGI